MPQRVGHPVLGLAGVLDAEQILACSSGRA